MKKIASKSTHPRVNHAALIFAGSRLIATGYNTKTCHAEISAIKKLWNWMGSRRTQPRNLHLISVMIKKKTGDFGNSAPCARCLTMIHAVGIKSFTYFNGKEFVEVD